MAFMPYMTRNTNPRRIHYRDPHKPTRMMCGLPAAVFVSAHGDHDFVSIVPQQVCSICQNCASTHALNGDMPLWMEVRKLVLDLWADKMPTPVKGWHEHWQAYHRGKVVAHNAKATHHMRRARGQRESRR